MNRRVKFDSCFLLFFSVRPAGFASRRNRSRARQAEIVYDAVHTEDNSLGIEINEQS